MAGPFLRPGVTQGHAEKIINGPCWLNSNSEPRAWTRAFAWVTNSSGVLSLTSAAGCGAQRFGLVGGFPRELRFVAAEVAVGGGLAVDRS